MIFLRTFSYLGRVRRLLIVFCSLSAVVAVLLIGSSESPVYKRTANPVLLCIFTTFKPVQFKLQLYENVLRNWASLNSNTFRIRCILYTTNHSIRTKKSSSIRWNLVLQEATRLGWNVYGAPRVSHFGVPYIKDMFLDSAQRFPDCVFRGYSNADILFSSTLYTTLAAIQQVLGDIGPTMVIGRRTNFRVANRKIYLSDEVDRVAKTEGDLFIPKAQDYFFISSFASAVATTTKPGSHTGSLPWWSMADVVVGRRGYDNYLVAMAAQAGLAVVDATETLTAAHQTDSDGNKAGFNATLQREFNMLAIGNQFPYDDGATSLSRYMTTWQANYSRGMGSGDVVVSPMYRADDVEP